MAKSNGVSIPGSIDPGSLRLAAIDVGSNSVHMIVAQIDSDGGVTTLWRVKEMVGLGRICFPSKKLSREAMDRAIASLARMQQAARQRQAEKLVAVATSAIRESDNGGELIERIKRDLKLYVKVVSAREEARLIYLGVRTAMNLGKHPHLIIDIGGGSVEFIVGNAHEAKLLESRKLGAARMTAQFVKSDPISKQDLAAMRQHFENELAPLAKRILAHRPVACIGTSGTLENIAALCGGEIKRERIEKLEKQLIKSDSSDRSQIRGIDEHRKDQILAGVVMMSTAMRLLKLKKITLCGAALREGILGDYLSRHAPDLKIRLEVADPRRRSVLDLARRCHWYESHSTQVSKLILRLFDELRPIHGLGDRERELIDYGALLHDIGWHITPDRHHRHSEYLILNGGLKNFDDDEVIAVATMARCHRKSPPDRKKHELYARLPAGMRRTVDVGVALLRIADSLDRSHASAVQELKCRADKSTITVEVKSPADIQLELWAARNKREWMEKVFKRTVTVEQVKGKG